MEEKISLIVGGNGGIGSETAKLLDERGFTVCLFDKTHSEKSINKDSFNVDVMDIEMIRESLSSIIKKYSRIDSVVFTITNEILNKSILETDWGEFQKHIDVQIKGFYNLICAISSLKLDNKIKFIIVLTEYCFGKPPSKIAPYITAKYGLMGLVKSMASEFNPKKFTFNMVSPGMVNTNLLKNLPPKMSELTSYNNPMKRIAEPIDVARVIAFLISDEADYLNGVNIPINGGNIFI